MKRDCLLDEIFIETRLDMPDTGPQTDTHASAVQDIFRTLLNGCEKNVLTAGMWLNGGNVACMWPNMAANIVSSRAWEEIHARIGTEMLRFLLLHCSVYVPLETSPGMLFQVCGPKQTIQRAKRASLSAPSCFYNERFLKRAGFEPEHVLFHKTRYEIVRSMYKIVNTASRLPKRFTYMLKHVQHVLDKFQHVPYRLLLEVSPQNHPLLFLWRCLRRLLPVCGNKWVLYEWLKQSLINPRHVASCAWKCRKFLPRHLHRHYAELARGWCTWIWQVLVIPLIRNHWYVTENAEGRVEYFRKPAWRLFQQSQHVEQVLNLSPVGHAPDRAHSLRLIPSGGRIIERCFRDEKWPLRIILACMSKHWGDTVTNYQQVYRKLLAYKERNPSGPYYYLKLDVARAYDSIDQHKLLDIVRRCNIFPHASYTVLRFRANGKLLTRVVPTGQEHLVTFPKGVVVSDCAWGEVWTRAHLYDMVEQHVLHNVVWYRGRKWLQKRGIPQGSVLSGALCCLYYAHVLEEVCNDVWACPDDCLRMRWMDDTIFISNSLERVSAFKESISHLLPIFNVSKSVLSPVSCVSWCGLILNESLEVSWKYAQGAPIRGSLRKLPYYVRAKFGLRVLFCLRLNSRETVAKNAREAVLYICKKVGLQLGRGKINPNP